MANTPSDWFPNNVAIDCLWYEEFEGNQLCSKYGCTLGVDEDSPCVLCKTYYPFEEGQDPKEFIRKFIEVDQAFSLGPDGQYRINGM